MSEPRHAMTSPFPARLDRVRSRLRSLGLDALAVSVGPDLPWLCGYEAMPLERLTMLVVPVDGPATLVVPALEAPRVNDRGDVTVRPWGEADDPIAIVDALVPRGAGVAIGDRTWARFLIEWRSRHGELRFERAQTVTGVLRERKEPSEIAVLQRAAAAVDGIAAELQSGTIPLVGRTEADVAADLSRRLLAAGHHRVNFAIVAAGANAASPHHEPGLRRIEAGEVVLCDFGGTMLDDFGVGYCSDITRCVWTGEPSSEVRDIYGVLERAQAAGVAAGEVGNTCEAVDAACRRIIDDAGFGEFFIHRTGHGIGVEEHEDPYIVAGNRSAIEVGNAWSIEPGIYLPGRFGMRLEDIVVATEAGSLSLNRADHALAIVG